MDAHMADGRVADGDMVKEIDVTESSNRVDK